MNSLEAKCDRIIRGSLFAFAFAVPMRAIIVSEAVVCLGILAWVVKCAARRKLAWKRTPYDLPILFFLLLVVGSALWGVNRLHSLRDLRSYGLILVVYLLPRHLAKRDLKFFVYALLLSMAAASLWTCIWYPVERAHGMPLFEIGTMTQPGKLLFMLPLALSLFLGEKDSRKWRLLLVLAIMLMVGAMVLNFKRGAWISLVVGVIFLLAVKARKFLLVLPILLALIFAFKPVRDRIWMSKDELQVAKGGRLAMWRVGPKIVRDHPLGIGSDNTGELMYKYDPGLEEGRSHLHNTYLDIAVQYSLLGLGAYLWWMAVFARLTWRNFRRAATNSLSGSISLGILAGFLGFLLNGLVEFNFGDSEVAMILYAFMGIALILGKGARENGS